MRTFTALMLTHSTVHVAAKGDLSALTRSLAEELGAAEYHLNSVVSGVILAAIHEYDHTPETLEAMRLTTAATPLGRRMDWITPGPDSPPTSNHLALPNGASVESFRPTFFGAFVSDRSTPPHLGSFRNT